MIKRLLLTLFFLASGSTARAIPYDQVPNPRETNGSWVQDSAGVLSPAYFDLINDLCSTLEANTSAELAVVTIDQLEGLSIEDYSQKLFQRYGIGKKDKNNGLLILFAQDDRKIRIHVGYGLESITTDATAGKLLDQWAVPRFKEQAYGRGLYDLAKALVLKVSDGLNSPLNLGTLDDVPREATASRNPPPTTYRSTAEVPWSWSIIWLYVAVAGGLTFLGLLWSCLQAFLPNALAAKRKALGSGLLFSIVIWFLGGIAAFAYGALSENYLYSFGIYGVVSTLLTLLRQFVGKALKRYINNYRFHCPKCSKPMTCLGETQDDKYLSQEEIGEELARGMDYEFWQCDPCDYLHRFDVKLSGASKCSKCGRRSLTSESRTVRAATTSSSGAMRITYHCHNSKCHHHREETRTIPRISTSSGSSSGSSWRSSGGSSFGGGSSGGGGASRSW